MIKSNSVHTQTAHENGISQKLSLCLSLFLSEKDFSQYLLFCQLSLYGPALPVYI